MAARIRDIPELVAYQTGRSLIRIPCEQDVPFTRRIRALVDTEEFQRLQHISQLGLVQRVYPGATHTRFEHALGVFHNAVRYLNQLGQNDRFCEIVSPYEAELFLVAALLHDLGHWPFCHPIEDMALAGIPSHEVFARAHLLGSTELNQVLHSVWNIDPHDVFDILVASSESSSRQLLRSILSGPIDIDKMDYLDRDSLHAGVPYGRNYDRNRLISSLTVNESGNGIAMTSKGKTAAELMVFARYVMFSEVYWHHAVRAATNMFARAFYELQAAIDLQAFFLDRESTSIETLRRLATGSPVSVLTEGLFGSHRMLYKRVAEFSAVDHPECYAKLAHKPYHELIELTARLQAESAISLSGNSTAIDLLIDAPPPKREVEFRVDILFPKENRYRPLQSISPVVEALAQRQFDDYVKRVRIFVHPHYRDNFEQSALEQLISRW